MSDKLRSCVHYIKAVTCVWQQISHSTDARFNWIRWGEKSKIQLCLLCCGGSREEGIPWYFFKFEILYSLREVMLACPKVTLATLGAMWPTLRTTDLKHESCQCQFIERQGLTELTMICAALGEWGRNHYANHMVQSQFIRTSQKSWEQWYWSGWVIEKDQNPKCQGP
jgi:hypothetical protein